MRRNRFDLVVLDFALPDGTAFDIQGKLGSEDDPPATGFVTADEDADTAVRAFEGGAHGYVVKRPGFGQKLADRVAQILDDRAKGADVDETNAPQTSKAALALVHQFGKELFCIRTHAKRLEDSALTQAAHERAAAIRKASDEMARSARRFLDESTASDARRERIGLRTAIDRAIEIAARVHGANRVRCERDGAEELQVDECLVDAIVNLLDNALRASSDDQPVVISTNHRGFSVTDAGAGMSAEVLARCFELGFSTRRGEGGHGVGLTIVKQTIEAIGGELRVTSALGQGSRVEVRF